MTTKLFNKNFVLLWQGQLVSQVGSQAFSIAMMFWVKHETGSASLMGLLLMFSSIPGIILSPIGGAFADRHSRKRIIIVSDLINGVAVLTLYVVIAAFSEIQRIALLWLFCVATLNACVGSFFRPAITAAIPDIVPADKVAAANSLNQSSMQISMLLGQGIGGVLYRILGAPLLFLLDGLSYLFSAISESVIEIPQDLPQQKRTSWKELGRSYVDDLWIGLKFVFNNAGIRTLLFCMAFMNFFGVPFIVLLPFFVEDILQLPVDWYGFFLGAYGAGSLLGYTTAGILRFSGRRRMHALVGSLVAMSAGLGILGTIEVPVVALALFSVVGIFNGYFNVNVITILQQASPSHIRGKVFGVVLSAVMALTPIAMSFSGILADTLSHDISAIYVSCGSVLVVLSLIVGMNQRFRSFLEFA